MNTSLLFLLLFAVAVICIIAFARRQEKAELEKFWTPISPIINAHSEKQSLIGSYENFEVRIDVHRNHEDNGEKTYNYDLILQSANSTNSVSASDWTLAYGSEFLGQGEWKWRIKSRDAAAIQLLESRNIIGTIEKMVPQCLSKNVDEAFIDWAQMQRDRAQARVKTSFSSENIADDSPWSSSSSESKTSRGQWTNASAILPVNEKTLNFVQRMNRWAIYPKIIFESRRALWRYSAKVPVETGITAAQFQSQLDLLIAMAKISRENEF